MERYEYDAFGRRHIFAPDYQPRSASTCAMPIGYTGQRLDLLDDNTLALAYFKARYYDPDTGRFLNRNPIGYAAGPNFYTGYMGVNRLDPLGLCTFEHPPLSLSPGANHDLIKHDCGQKDCIFSSKYDIRYYIDQNRPIHSHTKYSDPSDYDPFVVCTQTQPTPNPCSYRPCTISSQDSSEEESRRRAEEFERQLTQDRSFFCDPWPGANEFDIGVGRGLWIGLNAWQTAEAGYGLYQLARSTPGLLRGGAAGSSIGQYADDGLLCAAKTAKSCVKGAPKCLNSADDVTLTSTATTSTIHPCQLPDDALKAYDDIMNCRYRPNVRQPFRFRNDGSRGANFLPKTDVSGNPIDYLELTVNPRSPCGSGLDAKRFVLGTDGTLWYTDDHFFTWHLVFE